MLHLMQFVWWQMLITFVNKNLRQRKINNVYNKHYYLSNVTGTEKK